MKHSLYNRLSNLLWTVIVTLVILLAVYVSTGRLLMSNVGQWQQEILGQINQRLPFTIEAEHISGQWRAFSPVLVLRGIQLNLPDVDKPVVLSSGEVTLNLASSLRNRALHFSHIRAQGLQLDGSVDEQGQFEIAGFTGGGDGRVTQWLQSLVLAVEHLQLVNNSLELTTANGSSRQLSLDLSLYRDGSQRFVDAQLQSTVGTEITVLGEGLGNPFKPNRFRGELYLALGLHDLDTLRELLPQLAPEFATSGAAQLELWLDWAQGKPALALRLDAEDVLITQSATGAELPLDNLALAATVMENNQHWTVFAADVNARSGAVDLNLPRLQVDAWGDSLRLLASAVPIAPLNEFATSIPGVPATLAEVFTDLAPTGDLPRLELSTADFGDPGSEWQAQANFSDLSVISWRGAPGVVGASGFVHMAAGGGFVILDSSEMEMSFPSVYRHPLRYEEIHGQLNLGWDDQAFVISSDLITASAEEGVAKALFGLNVPFSKTDAGIEMDLMVGLEDSHPRHRDKYLPYTLPGTLLQWLDKSLGEGNIEQGAFLWRGSLRAEASQLRTVGLFFNLSDADITYDPRWPAVHALNGTVIIDDTNVSVWSPSAKIYGSELSSVSAEAWLDPQQEMQLAVRGHLAGSAADGLRIVNESALVDVVGETFASWQASGGLQTDLSLQLNLNRINDFPQVEVATQWTDVDLAIAPLSVSVEDISGELNFSSEQGFTSRDLHGLLWQQPLRAELHQQLDEAGRYQTKTSVLTIAMHTSVAAQSLQDWLQVDTLSLVDGEAEVDINLIIEPNQTPVATAHSRLLGVSLDLPQPWAKSVDTEKGLSLELPLAGEEKILAMNLEDELFLRLRLDGSPFGGMALGFSRPPIGVPDSSISLQGNIPKLDPFQWWQFIDRYVMAVDEQGANAEVVSPTGEPVPVLQCNLQVDVFSVWGLDIADAGIHVDHQPGQWQLAVSSDWISGRLELNEEFSAGELTLTYLDLKQLGELEVPQWSGSTESGNTLPDLRIEIEGLQYGKRQLGHIQFDLTSTAEQTLADNIVGELVGLSLTPEQPGKLVWYTGAEPKTELEAYLSFADLGQTMELLGYSKTLETDDGHFQLSYAWPGGPQDASLQAGRGQLELAMGKGRFLNSSAGTSGALKVVSILNLTDLVGRLSLPQMFESGIAFHQVDGEINANQGVVEVTALDVQGTSSAFGFTGVANVKNKDIDGELVVTLPVANNLPWIAALTAGLPVAAGVFIVSKVFEKQFDELSSGVYKVTGPWDDPQLDFDRVFDTDSQVAMEVTQAGSNSPPALPGSERHTETAPTAQPEEKAPPRAVPDPNALPPIADQASPDSES